MKRRHPSRSLPSWYPHFRMAYRAAALLLGAVLVAQILTHVTFAVISPFVKSHLEGVALSGDERIVQETRLEKRQLAARIAWLKSPQGALEESRRKGMVKAGEQEVRFTFASPVPVQIVPPAVKTTSHLWNQILWPGICLLALSFLFGSGWLFRRHRLARLRRPAGTLTPRSELQRRPRSKNAPFRGV